MVQGIVAVLAFCLFTFQISHQISFQQARRLSNITSLEQLFTEAQIIRNGIRLESANEVLPQLHTSGDQIYVGATITKLAMPDECSPRLTTVEVPREGVEDVNVQLWPRCTRVKRCGGCCANNMLKCVPKAVQAKPLMILRARLWDSSASDLLMDWEGYMQVEVQEHTACDIVCRITAHDCNRRQRFYESECSCRCRVVRHCTPLQRWDLETCRCVCKDPNRTCRQGTLFNPRNCRCRISRFRQTYSNLEIDSEEEQPNDLHHVHGRHSNALSAQNTVPPTSTSTTTTQTTTLDPCISQFCPPMFNKVRTGRSCICSPAFNFPGK